jgi:hypothetical protein
VRSSRAEPDQHDRDAELEEPADRLRISACSAISATATASSDAVCPSPHTTPTSAERQRLRRTLKIVDTAAR